MDKGRAWLVDQSDLLRTGHHSVFSSAHVLCSELALDEYVLSLVFSFDLCIEIKALEDSWLQGRLSES